MEAMISLVDAYRDKHGVEPIRRVIKIAPSTYHAHVARREQPETAPPRVKRDVMLSVEIRRVFDGNFQAYGVRKVWRQLLREGHDVARCAVARLMKKMALQGVIRGGWVRTTVSDRATPCPHDHGNRRFRAPRPNVLLGLGLHLRCDVDWLRLRRVSHRRLRPPHRRLARIPVGARRLRAQCATSKGTWLANAGGGFRRSNKAGSEMMLRRPFEPKQHVSIRSTERLAEAGLVPSVGSVGDSYDNALAVTINGLYKAR
jgi:putative transposase